MLTDKVKFSKRNMVEGFEYEFAKPKFQERDFGASYMTYVELQRGLKRAERRAKRATGDKVAMYTKQAEAYRKRLEERYQK